MVTCIVFPPCTSSECMVQVSDCDHLDFMWQFSLRVYAHTNKTNYKKGCIQQMKINFDSEPRVQALLRFHRTYNDNGRPCSGLNLNNTLTLIGGVQSHVFIYKTCITPEHSNPNINPIAPCSSCSPMPHKCPCACRGSHRSQSREGVSHASRCVTDLIFHYIAGKCRVAPRDYLPPRHQPHHLWAPASSAAREPSAARGGDRK